MYFSIQVIIVLHFGLTISYEPSDLLIILEYKRIYVRELINVEESESYLKIFIFYIEKEDGLK